MASDLSERTLTISGVKVIFPCKPYPSQFGMMDRVIKGIDRRQNCLLESPTGSGKTLALLCSALAWQSAQHEKLTKEGILTDTEKSCSKPCHCGANTNTTSVEYSPGSKPGTASNENKGDKDKPIELSDEVDNDFKPMSTFRTPKLGQGPPTKRQHVSVMYDDDNISKPETKCTCHTDCSTGTAKQQKVSRIYFGTRTHKQIAQITRELGRTAYHDVRILILASREYSCVHPEVSRMKSKSEGCRDLLDINGAGCKFNDRSKRVFLTQNQLQSELTTAWDLEDFVGACKSKKACPYFVTRNIKEQADIIFCPYNYLIDPLVRTSMDINLKDQVIILDEAHNIEDCARDAASGSLTTDQISATIRNIQEVLDCNVKFASHLTLKKMLDNVLQFVEDNSEHLEQADYDTSYKIWSGFDIVARLKTIGLGPDSYAQYKESLDNVSKTDDDEQSVHRNSRNQEVKLHSSSLQVLSLLVQIIDYMYRDDLKYVEDYRVAILKSMQYVPNKHTNDRWINRNKRGGSRQVVHTLNFWCMNPAVAFSDFSSCRNVVLSSGTLSPMSSFASELGVAFPIQLEANHVIQDKQVWVGALGQGPSGSQLQAVYRNMETFAFQDELGNLVHRMCMSVPHGVLCFLPSYRSLEKFIDRWKSKGIWEKIASRKRIMVEPRAADREDFDMMMKTFYDVIKGDTTSGYDEEDDCCEESEIDGAIFFAVCRGKVSEGMDFADNNARAVITVGIPYPSIKDLQVKLKREYNDKHRNDRGLLSGNDWYEIQAFRALNQALGRCIRHRKDWGALIMVDDRFVKNSAKYCKGLSKWVRSKVQTFGTFSQCIDSVSTFTDRMVKEMPVVNPDTSFIPRTPGTSHRESIYRTQDMDMSYQGTPAGCTSSQSPYFRSPSPGLARKLLQSPAGTPRKDNNAQESPKTENSKIVIPIPAEISSLPLQQQLIQVINSAQAPKDRAYYIVLDKDLHTEKMFLIEPNKSGKAPSTSTDNTVANPRGTVPSTVNTAATAGGLVPSTVNTAPTAGGLIHNTGTNVILTNTALNNSLIAPQALVPYQSIQPGQSLLRPFVSPPQAIPTAIPTVINVTCPAEGNVSQLLRQIINSPVAPTDTPYYIVVNQGQTSEQKFFIEPNKKATKPSATPQTTTQSSVQTNIPTAITSSVAMTAEVVPSVSTNENKFLKFCRLPKTPTSKVPVATVTPQRLNTSVQMAEITTGLTTTPGQTSRFSPPFKTDQQKSDPHRLAQQTNDPRADVVSPVLFDELSEGIVKDKLDVDKSITSTAGLQGEVNEPIQKKKPLFKKKAVKTEKLETVDKHKDVNGAVNNDNVVKQNMDDINSVAKTSKTPAEDSKGLTTRDKVNKSVVEKLKKFRRKSVDKVNEAGDDTQTDDKTSDTIAVCSDKKDHSKQTVTNDLSKSALREMESGTMTNATVDNLENSEEEFLNTRRKGGRKRRSSSVHRAGLKKTKGVDFQDEKENKKMDTKWLACAKCGSNWIKSTDYEKRRRHPRFLQGVCKRHTEVFFFNNIDGSCVGLEPVSTEVKGIQLDCHIDTETGCCIQYLHCKQCRIHNKADSVVGVKVIMVQQGTEFQSGHAWIVSTHVKT